MEKITKRRWIMGALQHGMDSNESNSINDIYFSLSPAEDELVGQDSADTHEVLSAGRC